MRQDIKATQTVGASCAKGGSVVSPVMSPQRSSRVTEEYKRGGRPDSSSTGAPRAGDDETGGTSRQEARIPSQHSGLRSNVPRWSSSLGPGRLSAYSSQGNEEERSMEVYIGDILIPRMGCLAWFNTDGWFPTWDIIDDGYPLFEPEAFGMELVTFRPIAVCTVYDPSAYSREHFPSGAQDLGMMSDLIRGELRKSTLGVLSGDWNSYQDGPVEAIGLRSLHKMDSALDAKWDPLLSQGDKQDRPRGYPQSEG